MKTKLLLYCTKAEPYLIKNPRHGQKECEHKSNYFIDSHPVTSYGTAINGKIVAECECEFEKILLLDTENVGTKIGYYALHLNNVKVLDKPLELKDCKKLVTVKSGANVNENIYRMFEKALSLRRAPRNMMWVWYNGQKYCLISIRPELFCEIVNGERTTLVRKKILKDMLFA